jgi:uncharacterized SAM-binding protein YcdF (DUF218 family)
VNSLFALLGMESWKPVITALLLPPVPFLLLMLIGARLMLPRRGLGWFIIVLSVALTWFSACTGTGQLLSRFVLRPPPALTMNRIKELKAPSPAKAATAIVVLGGGAERYAPEYGVSNLYHASLERLRFGVWLGRETGLPIAFSGGVGWASPDTTPEARIAAQVAGVDFNWPLKWIEENSRDTHENAARTVAMLRPLGIRHIVLVTHGWHMPRALAAFETAAAGTMTIEAAPMGLARHDDVPSLSWIPSGQGFTDVRNITRELLGRFAGA